MSRPLLGLLLFTCLFLTAIAEPTTVSYIYEVEKEEGQDFLELTISTSAEDASLQATITQSRERAKKLKQTAEQLCKSMMKDKSQCKEFAEIGKVQIEPSYRENKKQTIFQKISSKYEVVLKFQNAQKFGQMVDELLKMEEILIEKIEWVDDEDKDESNFFDESLEKSKEMCKEVGKNFVKVVSVEELREEPEKPEEEEPKQEEEEEEEEEQEPEEQQPEQEEEETTSYRITIICDGQAAKASKKTAKK